MSRQAMSAASAGCPRASSSATCSPTTCSGWCSNTAARRSRRRSCTTFGGPGDLRARRKVRRAPVPVQVEQPEHDAPVRGLLRHVLHHAGHAHLAQQPPDEDVRVLHLLVPARTEGRGDRARNVSGPSPCPICTRSARTCPKP